MTSINGRHLGWFVAASVGQSDVLPRATLIPSAPSGWGSSVLEGAKPMSTMKGKRSSFLTPVSLYDEPATMKVTTCNKNITWQKHRGIHDICWRFRTLINLLMPMGHGASIYLHLKLNLFAHPPALIRFEGISFKDFPKWCQMLTSGKIISRINIDWLGKQGRRMAAKGKNLPHVYSGL